ncbi:MAG: Ig-like domain-containing protein, partial [Intestinibaculum porci]|uniref:Ig-like domain-containing protein n=2 Tax=Intestinibaculum porci TaxID=2487118 RepID=UPI00240A6D8F
MAFHNGVTTLPVEATTSWQANAEIGHVEGSTFIANPNLGNREATLQAQATFGGYTASQDAALTVYCSHEKTHYAPQGAYHNKVCDLCGKIIDYQSHEWDEGTVTKEATEDQEGVRTYTCKDCGATKTEAIAKLPKKVVKETSSDNSSPAPAAASTITQKQADTSVNNTVTSSVKSKAVTKPVTGKAYTTSTKKTVIGKKNITLKAPEKGQVKWQTSNKKVATVSKGKVKIKGYGTVKIEAKVNGHTYILNVKKPMLKVNKKKITLKKGKSLKIKAQSNGKVKWKSQNKKIAKVVQGRIKGLKKGSTTVIASSSGVKV